MSLFDVEDVDVQPNVRDMIVAPVTAADVDSFCRRYHYTATGGNMQWRWGLWNGPTLHGVVAYNVPTRQVCDAVFGAHNTPSETTVTETDPAFDGGTVTTETVKATMNVLHMGRLALSEESPRNSESRLIAGSLKALSEKLPWVWGVLTYADTSAGHIGTVYQATNALYTGTGGDSTYYIDQDGRRHGTYMTGTHIKPDEARRRGWTVFEGGAKHRYLYILGNKTERRYRRTQLRFPVLPYPKKDQP